MTMDKLPELRKLNYDLPRVLTLLRGWDDLANQQRSQLKVENTPGTTADDVAATARIIGLHGDIAALSGSALEATVGLLEPYGLIQDGANVGEALNGIPDDWSEASMVHRLIILFDALKQLDNVLRLMTDDAVSDADWERKAERVLDGLELVIPSDGDDAEETM